MGTADDPIRAAYGVEARAARDDREPMSAYQHASQVRDVLDDLVGEAAELRAEMAFRLMQREGLSVSQLAARLGVSKARAGQFALVGRRVHESRLAPDDDGQQTT